MVVGGAVEEVDGVGKVPAGYGRHFTYSNVRKLGQQSEVFQLTYSTSHSSCLPGVSIRSIKVPQKCQILCLNQEFIKTMMNCVVHREQNSPISNS